MRGRVVTLSLFWSKRQQLGCLDALALVDLTSIQTPDTQNPLIRPSLASAGNLTARQAAACHLATLTGGRAAGCMSWRDVEHWMWPLWSDRWASWRQSRLGLPAAPLLLVQNPLDLPGPLVVLSLGTCVVGTTDVKDVTVCTSGGIMCPYRRPC